DAFEAPPAQRQHGALLPMPRREEPPEGLFPDDAEPFPNDDPLDMGFSVAFDDESNADSYPPEGFGLPYDRDDAEPHFGSVEFADAPLSADMSLGHFRREQDLRRADVRSPHEEEVARLEPNESYIYQLTEDHEQEPDAVSLLLEDENAFDEPLEMMADVPADVGAEIDALFKQGDANMMLEPELADVSGETALSAPDMLYTSMSTINVDQFEESYSSALDASAQGISNAHLDDLPPDEEIEDALEYLRHQNLLKQCPSVDYSQVHNVDHRAGFLLGQADGMVTIEDLIDFSGMNSRDAAAIVVDLLHRGALRV
ncbi:MAG: hypothetical protein AAFS10_20360, partial [Myxococcota bacterium]